MTCVEKAAKSKQVARGSVSKLNENTCESKRGRIFVWDILAKSPLKVVWNLKKICQTLKINERSELFVVNIILFMQVKSNEVFTDVYSVLRKLSSCAHPRYDRTYRIETHGKNELIELNCSHSRKNKKTKQLSISTRMKKKEWSSKVVTDCAVANVHDIFPDIRSLMVLVLNRNSQASSGYEVLILIFTNTKSIFLKKFWFVSICVLIQSLLLYMNTQIAKMNASACTAGERWSYLLTYLRDNSWSTGLFLNTWLFFEIIWTKERHLNRTWNSKAVSIAF